MAPINTIINNFSNQSVSLFFENKITSFKPEKEIFVNTVQEETPYSDPVKIGHAELNNHEELLVFTCECNKELTERSAKKRQFEIAKKVLKEDFKDGAIFIFYDEQGNFRFSFIRRNYGEKADKKYSTWKRYTYYVSPSETNKTFKNRIENCKFNSLDNIQEAFSVEKLTKEFYNELFAWYQWSLSEEIGVTFPHNTEITEDDRTKLEEQIIRLITRLLFVWFIKQKKLVPDEIFEIDKLSSILKDFDSNSVSDGNYYNAILQNLFFATLNKEINEREFAKLKNRDIKTRYRYEEMFNLSEQEILELFKPIPFLNGGLFECLDKEQSTDGVKYHLDGFSRNDKKFTNGNYKYRAFIPNCVFFDEENGIIPLLKRYNFTVEENAPNEVQVALDPELLGKVFENLLGAFNPETKETARKQSGSFYTPREIVDYMVNESLTTYLLNDFPDVEENTIRNLFEEEKLPDVLVKDHSLCEKLSRKLRAVKILDPACGSGAFPMGILNKMVEVLEKLDCKNEKTIHDLKLHLIEECIYGIDIQTIATQISKLRFFISLVVEQGEIDLSKPDENYGVLTLPNLETKFVAANTLIGIKKKKEGEFVNTLFTDPEIETTKQELLKIRREHFYAKTAGAKKRLRELDAELRTKLTKLLQDNNEFAPEDALQFSKWNPYDQNAGSPFFDTEWMFGLQEGFDVVIGNPPYISTKGIDSDFKKKLKNEYGFADDTYSHFFFKGDKLLAKYGIISYITPKTFWTTQTKRNLRDLILSKFVKYIFDTANPFEAAMVDTCITSFVNIELPENNIIRFLDGRKNLNIPERYTVEQALYLDTQNSVIFKPTELNLKIQGLYGEKIKELYDKWWDKIKTSRDIAKHSKELEEYRKSLKPGDIALLGCLTEGGQGLATANNGKYIAIRKSTKWADKIVKSRPKKLAKAIKSHNIQLKGLNGFVNEKEFLESLTEKEIADLFDLLKEKYGRDIFGQGYLFRIVEDNEIADVEALTKDEKENGIDTSKNYYVPYDKGDKDGNRWYLETPFAIAWSKENVRFLKTDPRARYQGYLYYFREGFCYSDINTTYLKCRLKSKTINDVKSMSLYSLTDTVPAYYITSLINSSFISLYVDDFVNNTQTFQINDARQLPVLVPSEKSLLEIKKIATSAIDTKKKQFKNEISKKEAERILLYIQKELDTRVKALYNLV